MSNTSCYKCGEVGHFARNCPTNNRDDEEVEDSGVEKVNEYMQELSLKEDPSRQKKALCFKCNMPGHKASECDSGFQIRRTNKVCYKCHKMGHIARDCNSRGKDEANSSPGSDDERDNKGNYTRAFTRSTDRRNRCFRCNRHGHIVRDCPESEDRCYNCYRYGHIAKDCTYSPNHDGVDDSRKEFIRPKRYNNSSKRCYICNEEGHLAVMCPKSHNEDDRTCYNCGVVGHISHDCPESGLNRPAH